MIDSMIDLDLTAQHYLSMVLLGTRELALPELLDYPSNWDYFLWGWGFLPMLDCYLGLVSSCK